MTLENLLTAYETTITTNLLVPCVQKNNNYPLHLDKFLKTRKGNNLPLVVFTEDIDGQTVGCSRLEAACGLSPDGTNLAFVDMFSEKSLRQRAQESAKTLSHEIGHLV